MIEAQSRSPDAWEREIARTRADIDRTLTALRLRLSRGAIMDRVIEASRQEGGAFAAGVGRTIRDNPVPAVVLGAGLAWLLMASRDQGGRTRAVVPVARPRGEPHRSPVVAGSSATGSGATGSGAMGAGSGATGAAVTGATVETPSPAPKFHDAERPVRATDPSVHTEGATEEDKSVPIP